MMVISMFVGVHLMLDSSGNNYLDSLGGGHAVMYLVKMLFSYE